MRNKKLPIVALLALCASAWGQEAGQETPAPPKSAPEKPAAGPAKTETAAVKPEAAEEEERSDAQAPKRFVPSQRTPADNSASFPVDI